MPDSSPKDPFALYTARHALLSTERGVHDRRRRFLRLALLLAAAVTVLFVGRTLYQNASAWLEAVRDLYGLC